MASRPGSTSPVEGNGFDRHLEAGHGNLNGASKEKGVHVADGVNGQDEEGKEYQVTFDHPASSPDIVNPYSIPKARKWLFVICTSLTSACVTCVSSLYTTTYEQLEKEWGVSEMVCTLGLSLFVAGLGLGPMLLAPLSEFFGRRPIYALSMLMFVIWLVPCAVAGNIQTLLIARFVNGFAGSAFLSVAGGTVSDLFQKEELQLPMLIYTASPFAGPVIGPVIGGFINQYVNWRWSFWTMLIWSAVQWMLVTFVVPETYHPVLLRKKAERTRKESGNEQWYAPIEREGRSVREAVTKSLYRPFLLLTLEPMCLCLCIFSALLLGILYLFFGAFHLIFTNVYHFNLHQVGLSFLGLLVGTLIAVSTDPLWQKNYLHLVQKREKEGGEQDPPEFRLPPAMAGAPLVCIGLFWFGWTTYPTIHWIVPIIGSLTFGVGLIFVYSGIFTFLVAAYPAYAASALAANGFARSSFALAFPLFGTAMYKSLGYQWATTLLAFLSLAMVPFPYVYPPFMLSSGAAWSLAFSICLVYADGALLKKTKVYFLPVWTPNQEEESVREYPIDLGPQNAHIHVQ